MVYKILLLVKAHDHRRLIFNIEERYILGKYVDVLIVLKYQKAFFTCRDAKFLQQIIRVEKPLLKEMFKIHCLFKSIDMSQRFHRIAVLIHSVCVGLYFHLAKILTGQKFYCKPL